MTLLDEIRALKGKYITVGIHGDQGSQKKIIRTISASADLQDVRERLESAGVNIKGRLERHRLDKNLTVEQVAAWNEFGTHDDKGKQLIPPRPFVRSVIQFDEKKIVNVAKRWLTQDPSSFFEELGTFIVNQIKLNITKKIFAPNAASTIKRKGSSTPLIDFGQLRSSITYKIGGT